jgi:hypothetical protein
LKRTRALDVCASLERREAALQRAELSIVAACDDADRYDDRVLLASRSAVARLQLWASDSCAFVDLRRVRSTVERAGRAFESERARERAVAHDTLRRHWASLVRGLRRRESRRGARSEDTACLG